MDANEIIADLKWLNNEQSQRLEQLEAELKKKILRTPTSERNLMRLPAHMANFEIT